MIYESRTYKKLVLTSYVVALLLSFGCTLWPTVGLINVLGFVSLVWIILTLPDIIEMME